MSCATLRSEVFDARWTYARLSASLITSSLYPFRARKTLICSSVPPLLRMPRTALTSASGADPVGPPGDVEADSSADPEVDSRPGADVR